MKDISFDDLSPFAQHCREKIYGKSRSYKARKLIASFEDRVEYIVHGTNLLFYLQHGMVLKKIHNIITFKQAPFLREHILRLTDKRRQAKSKAFKMLYKLMVNSIYGNSIIYETQLRAFVKNLT